MTPHASDPDPRPQSMSSPTRAMSFGKLLTITMEAPPFTPRRSTEPVISTTSTASEDPTTPTSPSLSKLSTLPLRPRNRSPYARTHLRTRSSASSLSAPPMTRAHSSPIVDAFGHVHMGSGYQRPSSPLFSPSSRRQSPLRRPIGDDTYPSFAPTLEIDQTISENSELELDLTPRQEEAGTPNSPFLSSYNTFPRSRRRPSSPLHSLVPPPLQGSAPLHTSTSSPTLGKDAKAAARYNEAYPSYSTSSYSHSSSSMPSTPTSLRSRSPSVSSLETIPDAPDAEAAAQEADCVARLKAAAERDERRRKGFDAVGRGGSRDKRKRWSVCGAERRGDLDLETIWED